MAHTVDCAHDWCAEWSVRASYRPVSAEEEAAEHRASLAGDGWTDLEGRLYCPDHNPFGGSE